MGQRRERHIRVRGKRLDQVDETKLALAVWMMARKLVVDGTEQESADPAVASEEPQQLEEPRADSQEAA
jgi:hypothetical protein